MKRIVAIMVEAKPPLFLAVKLEERDILDLMKHGAHVVELREERDPVKKGMTFLAPLLPLLPEAATVVGAATLGVVGGAAGYVGGRIGEWVWPQKKDKKPSDE